MDTKTAASDRLDALDQERFRDMVDSPPFRLYLKRLNAELERSRSDCERKTETLEIHRAQGACAAFHVALALPDLILKEIERRVSG